MIPHTAFLLVGIFHLSALDFQTLGLHSAVLLSLYVLYFPHYQSVTYMPWDKILCDTTIGDSPFGGLGRPGEYRERSHRFDACKYLSRAKDEGNTIQYVTQREPHKDGPWITSSHLDTH